MFGFIRAPRGMNLNVAAKVRKIIGTCKFRRAENVIYMKNARRQGKGGLPKTMQIAYVPLENGVPQTPLPSAGSAADTTVFTGHILIFPEGRQSERNIHIFRIKFAYVKFFL